MPSISVDPEAVGRLSQELGARSGSNERLHLLYENPTPDFVLQHCALNFFNDLIGTIKGEFEGKDWSDCLSLHEDAYENWYAAGIDVSGTDPPVVVLTHPLPIAKLWSPVSTPQVLAGAAEALAALVTDALPYVAAAATVERSERG